MSLDATAVIDRVFVRRGAVREAFRSRDPELMVAGPAGTGKSRGLLELLHFRALKYDGCRGLIVRKERKTLTQTALVTFNKEVQPDLDGVRWRTQEQEYRYPNGTVIVVGGLDHEGRKVMSGQYDWIYANEATELGEAEWENLTTRLRNNVCPYQQIFGDCNPGPPTHWLKQRADAGKCRMLDSRHEDNPALYDLKQGEWTESGARYLEKLESLSSVRYLRLRKGIWAAAEGLVYENWDRNVHLVDPFTIPSGWARFWSVDFGYTNPFVWQAWAQDPDGRLYRYREIYRTQRLVEDHAKDILRLTADEPQPQAIICDHDAEDRATLERHLKMRTTAAYKAVSPGIQAVDSRLKKAGDGRPRLFLVRGALVDRDASLVAAHKPTCTEEEVDSYVWQKAADGKPVKEAPVKEDDHGLDAERYMVAHVDKIRRGKPETVQTSTRLSAA